MEQLKVTQMMITDPNALFYLTGKWIHPGERFLGLLLYKPVSKPLELMEKNKKDSEIML